MIRTGWWDSFTGWIANASGALEDGILQLAATAWIYVAIFGVTVIDGIVPPVPSESVVIAASATWAVSGHPALWGVWLAAAVGAWCGDQLVYSIGRAINVRRIPFLRGPKGHALLEWADRSLEKRGAAFILAARFIPVGRVAVNLTAGALRYPRKRFMAIDAIGAAVWATFGVTIGAFAGSVVRDNLWAAIAVGVMGGIVFGLLIDRLLTRFGVEPADLPAVDALPEFHLHKKNEH